MMSIVPPGCVRPTSQLFLSKAGVFSTADSHKRHTLMQNNNLLLESGDTFAPFTLALHTQHCADIPSLCCILAECKWLIWAHF